MNILEFVSELQQKYDLPELLIILAAVYFLWRKIKVVDHAVNNRPVDGPTLSQEVSQIHRKVDVTCNELKHLKDGQREMKAEIDEVKKDVKDHRLEDERIIASFTKEISELKTEIQKPKASRQRKTTNTK
jgi:hypothetical protein